VSLAQGGEAREISEQERVPVLAHLAKDRKAAARPRSVRGSRTVNGDEQAMSRRRDLGAWFADERQPRAKSRRNRPFQILRGPRALPRLTSKPVNQSVGHPTGADSVSAGRDQQLRGQRVIVPLSVGGAAVQNDPPA
jgi:hypothetical protein